MSASSSQRSGQGGQSSRNARRAKQALQLTHILVGRPAPKVAYFGCSRRLVQRPVAERFEERRARPEAFRALPTIDIAAGRFR